MGRTGATWPVPAALPRPAVIAGTPAIGQEEADVAAGARRAAISPQARARNPLQFAAPGTSAGIGGAQAEATRTDAVTGPLLAAGAARRGGGGSRTEAAPGDWGAAEHVLTAWATQVTERLYSWTSGAVRPS